MKYLNLGCGRRFHSDWTNVDFTSTGEGVIAHNLTQGLPFPDSSFDVIYHSHVLEHFTKNTAESFLSECCRVLRSQGILRVVVPDLEQIAKIYLVALEKVNAGFKEWAANYEWILLEMYDQTVRNNSGGEMGAYLLQEDIPNEEFVLKRYGIEAKNLIEAGRQHQQTPQSSLVFESQPKGLLKQIYRFLRNPDYRREFLLKTLLGNEYNALQIGRFRQSGEVHQWMYDRHSLSILLEKCGLENIVQRSATESYIPNWTSFNLDTEPDGTVYKPDSLFMEAIKLTI
ncbi:class I SAM-dependent methyltransferase [Oxynema aestuarii]|uniref:Methyltransferase domain-containing protein n=1 Tax=Oxynema aestuarii AP17 TaxID=2064643 RepID=A0A6H1U0Z3_9CYAN|nr:methyltransferase domain-containing protein [Oxynema aestuarii]QIZ72501.1 methyltransferase domain-containing protein [Oxynema aestuarii AP17]